MRDLPYLGHEGQGHGFATMMFILPEQGVALLSFTNSGSGGPFDLAVQRAVLEQVFEGARPLAEARLEYLARTMHEQRARNRERVTRVPDTEWVRSLVGAYTNADLGTVVVSADPRGGASFDAGEWKSGLGQKAEADGTVKGILLDPPIAGMELLVGGDDARRTLTLVDEQVQYEFVRTGK